MQGLVKIKALLCKVFLKGPAVQGLLRILALQGTDKHFGDSFILLSVLHKFTSICLG